MIWVLIRYRIYFVFPILEENEKHANVHAHQLVVIYSIVVSWEVYLAPKKKKWGFL